MEYLILVIRNVQKKCKNSFANCQNVSQIASCEHLIRALVRRGKYVLRAFYQTFLEIHTSLIAVLLLRVKVLFFVSFFNFMVRACKIHILENIGVLFDSNSICHSNEKDVVKVLWVFSITKAKFVLFSQLDFA